MVPLISALFLVTLGIVGSMSNATVANDTACFKISHVFENTEDYEKGIFRTEMLEVPITACDGTETVLADMTAYPWDLISGDTVTFLNGTKVVR